MKKHLLISQVTNQFRIGQKLKIFILFFALLFIPLSKSMAHGVQVGYCQLSNGYIRIFVEHWHGDLSSPSDAGTMSITTTYGSTTVTANLTPTGVINNTTYNNLSGCGSNINIISQCSGEANANNDWVYYDFAPAACNVAVQITLNAGNTVVLAEGCSNLYPATINATFNDNAGPILTCKDLVITACSAQAVNYSVTAVDACDPNPSISYSPASGSTFSMGTTQVTVTATDNTNHTSKCTFNVTLVDNVKPTITCPSNLTVNAEQGKCAACNVNAAPPSPVTLDYATRAITYSNVSLNGGSNSTIVKSGANVNITYNMSVAFNYSTGYCPGCVTQSYIGIGGTNQVIQCEHPIGNGYSGSRNVNFTAPSTPGVYYITQAGSLDYFCYSSIGFNNDFNNAIAMIQVVNVGDNCGVASITNNAPSCYNVGNTDVTWTVTDVYGNKESCVQTVTVIDNQKPVITCPSNITVSNDAGKCGASVSITDATASDNCEVQSVVGVRSDAAALTDEYPVGTTTITWTATDIHGNKSSCTQTVTVNDTENPKISCPSDFDIENDPSKCGASVSVGSATASDNCSIQSIVGVRSDAAALNADYPVGTTTITWTATDIHNNTATCTQTVKVSDKEAPVITSTAGSLDANLECSNSSGISSALDAKPSATDNCTSNPTLNLVSDNTYNTITTTGFTGSYAPSNWSLIKTSGSSGSVNTSSAPNSIQLYGSDGGGGGTKDTRYQVTVPTAGTITFSWTYTTTDRDGPAYDPFGYYLNGTFYQLSNNGGGNNQSGTKSVSVSVNDNFAFLIRSTDNVLGASTTIASNFTAVTQLCANEYIRVRTWNFTDAVSNVSSYFTQTIHVSDNTAPNVVTQTATVYLDANGNGSIGVSDINNGTTDNCGTITYSLDKTSFNCSNIGSNTVTLTAKDACGNIGSNTANVVVIDNVKPNAICQNITVTLSGGTASITASQVDNGSNDACGIKSISVSPNTFNCSNIGANTVTLTVTDNNDNVSTCDATVTVEGAIPTCSIDVTPSNNTNTGGVATNIYLGYGPQSATMTANATGGSGFTYSWSPATYLSASNIQNPVFTPTAEGNYTYVVTVTNSNGCVTTCSKTFCVKNVQVSGTSGKKVYLCHLPPGNNQNPQTLSISTSAVSSHIGNHSGDALGSCGATCYSNKRTSVDELVVDIDKLEIICSPNPFTQSFKLNYISAFNTEATISVYSIEGKLLESTSLIGNSNNVELGKDLPVGIYNISFVQGDIIKIFKMIKVN